MFTKITLAAIPALALAIGFGTPAFAASPAPCADEVAQVQAAWDAMYPMAMHTGGNQGIGDALRIAKEKCKEGDTAAVQQYLNVVRSHLDMPQHAAPHTR